jgi:hypothetical protein
MRIHNVKQGLFVSTHFYGGILTAPLGIRTVGALEAVLGASQMRPLFGIALLLTVPRCSVDDGPRDSELLGP